MIVTGTCSWAEKTLVKNGEFYPREANTAEARLRYYAGLFGAVEVDSTFYALPDTRNAALWAERTPAHFIFHIKAYAGLTGHGVAAKVLPKDLRDLLPKGEREKERIYIRDRDMRDAIARRFRDSVAPLKEAGKLGVMVFQFPPWFHYGAAGLDYIMECKELMHGLDVAVEFRHGSWLAPGRAGSVIGFLRENGLIYITADEPQYGTLDTIPYVPLTTADIAYFRLHGRNTRNWLKKGVETSLRYDYFYSDEELKGFAADVRRVSRQAK
ncbi:MAG TPA: DUF72 domain-containing protein, partial [Geobacteraceae bacterium]